VAATQSSPKRSLALERLAAPAISPHRHTPETVAACVKPIGKDEGRRFRA